MERLDFVQIYGAKSDEDLMCLSLEADQLTDEARSALSIELNNRRLTGSERIEEFKKEEEHAKDLRDKNIGYLGNAHIFGVGRQRFGKLSREYDPAMNVETYITTVFLVIFYFPVFPLCSFRVQGQKRLLRRGLTVVEKLPLNWRQVFSIWRWLLCARLDFSQLLTFG